MTNSTLTPIRCADCGTLRFSVDKPENMQPTDLYCDSCRIARDAGVPSRIPLPYSVLVAFLEDLSYDEKVGEGLDAIHIMPGHEAVENGHDYASEKALYYLMFEGSSLYNAFNHYDHPNAYDRDNHMYEFLKKHDVYMELGNAWNCNIYPNKPIEL